MTMNFGELSFAKDASPVVGLPLDVIDKVGTSLTDRYYKNRTAASSLQKEAINLPDSNSDVNKKIIQDLSSGIKDKFSQFAKQDSWFDADKAVFDTADELTSNPIVKDLIKYNMQYSKIDKDIEDSKAPEYYKQLQRSMNQQTNKGIRDDQGKAQQYQGIAISGDLDFTKYIKDTADLLSKWKADVMSYESNGNKMLPTMDPNFQELYHTFRNTTTKTFNEPAMIEYAHRLLQANPKFNAEVHDVARLNLYAQTGKTEPTAQDVTNIIASNASQDPRVLNQFIASSPEFNTETAHMKNAQDKMNYLYKISSNPVLNAKYVASGIDAMNKNAELIFGKNSKAYSQVYDDYTKQGIFRTVEGTVQGMANKDITFTEQNVPDSLTGKLYDEYKKGAGSMPIIDKGGQIDAGKATTYTDQRPTLLSIKNTLEAQLMDAKNPKNGTPANANVITKLQGSLDAAKRNLDTNDMIIENGLQNAGYSKESIIQSNKDNIIKDLIYSSTNPSTYGPYPGVEVQSNGATKPLLSKDDATKAFNIISKNLDNKMNTTQELKDAGLNIPDYMVNNMYDSFNRTIRNVSADILSNNPNATRSLPVEVLGYIGTNNIENDKYTKFYGDHLGTNLMSVIASPDAGRVNTTDGIGDNPMQKYYHSVTTGAGSSKTTKFVKNDIKIEFAKFSSGSSISGSKPLLRVTNFDPSTGTSKVELMRYEGDVNALKGVHQNTIEQSANSYYNPNNNYRDNNIATAKMVAGLTVSDLPVIAINNGSFKGVPTADIKQADISLGSTLENMTLVNGQYPIVKYDIGNNQHMSIVTSYNKETNLYNSAVYAGDNIETKPYLTLDNAADKTAILERIGAVQAYERSTNTTSRNNIGRMFGLIK